MRSSSGSATPADRARVLEEWPGILQLGWDEVEVSAVDDEYADVLGLSIADAAAHRGVDPSELARLDLIEGYPQSGDDGRLRPLGGRPLVGARPRDRDDRLGPASRARTRTGPRVSAGRIRGPTAAMPAGSDRSVRSGPGRHRSCRRDGDVDTRRAGWAWPTGAGSPSAQSRTSSVADLSALEDRATFREARAVPGRDRPCARGRRVRRRGRRAARRRATRCVPDGLAAADDLGVGERGEQLRLVAQQPEDQVREGSESADLGRILRELGSEQPEHAGDAGFAADREAPEHGPSCRARRAPRARSRAVRRHPADAAVHVRPRTPRPPRPRPPAGRVRWGSRHRAAARRGC